MIKSSLNLFLTLLVLFMGIQLNNDVNKKNKMRTNAKHFLTRFQMDHLIDHFNLCFTVLVVVTCLSPLAYFSKSLNIAAFFGGLAVMFRALLLEFDQENPLDLEFWKLMVVSFCLISL